VSKATVCSFQEGEGEMRCHSLTILTSVWFGCFWLLLISLFGGFLLLMSSKPYVEEADILWWRNVLFLAAAFGSMVYVRFWYYPWLMEKKRDPVLPRHQPADGGAIAPAHPLTISLI
jgi:hypothetical protein